MRRYFILCLFALPALGACQSVGLLNAPQADRMVGGQTFRIYGPGADGQAEAHSIQPTRRLGRGQTVANGARAMALATGCLVDPASLRGDEAIIKAQLIC